MPAVTALAAAGEPRRSPMPALALLRLLEQVVDRVAVAGVDRQRHRAEGAVAANQRHRQQAVATPRRRRAGRILCRRHDDRTCAQHRRLGGCGQRHGHRAAAGPFGHHGWRLIIDSGGNDQSAGNQTRAFAMVLQPALDAGLIRSILSSCSARFSFASPKRLSCGRHRLAQRRTRSLSKKSCRRVIGRPGLVLDSLGGVRRAKAPIRPEKPGQFGFDPAPGRPGRPGRPRRHRAAATLRARPDQPAGQAGKCIANTRATCQASRPAPSAIW